MKCSILKCDNKAVALTLCCKHYNRQYRHGTTNKPLIYREILLKKGKSYCPCCYKIKLLKYFNNDKNTWNKKAIYCKQCASKKGKHKYIKNKKKYKNSKLKRFFNISLDDYNRLLEKQNYKCAICNQINKTKNKCLGVDHCHKSGKIRGLLCDKCNFGLSNFNDDIKLLEEAIYYLQQGNLHKHELVTSD